MLLQALVSLGQKDMEDTSKDLLQFERKNLPSSSLESTLLFCDKGPNFQPKKSSADGKPFMAPMPKSQVMGKVKDFLGIMSEANKRLQQEAKDNASAFDIEALTGDESNVIEMDLMLGVADLHTPEAVAAAESAIVGYQQEITLNGSGSGTESESDYDSDEEDEQYDKENTRPPSELKRPESGEDETTSEADGKRKSKKRPKIVELP